MIIPPSSGLRSVIHHYEWYEFGKSNSTIRQIAFPSFSTGFLFCFYRGKKTVASNYRLGASEVAGAVMLSPASTPTQYAPLHNMSALRVIFRPGALSGLYGLSMNAFENTLPELHYIDRELLSVYDQLQNLENSRRRIPFLEKYLLRQLQRRPMSVSLFPAVYRVLQRFNHHISVEALAGELGRSRRHLNRLFGRNIGFTAKQFLRIYRFCRVVEHLHASRMPSMTQTAYHCGYADQAHFCHEFKSMTRLTPREFQNNMHRWQLVTTPADFKFVGVMVG